MRKLLRLFILAFLVHSCEQPVNEILSVAPHREICVLKENLTLLDRLNDVAMVSADQFVLCTDTKVVLYDADSGNQIRVIGKEGRGPFEYQMPAFVNYCDSTIYVRGGGDFEFITYSVDGEPLSKYPCSSAPQAFLPYHDSIFIYTNNYRTDASVIDVYDCKTKTVTDSIGISSYEHQVLCGMLSEVPMFIAKNRLLWMRKDELNVYSFDILRGGPSKLLGTIPSETFVVEQIRHSGELSGEARRKYLYDNPYSVCLYGTEENLFVITSEGKTSLKEIDGKEKMDDSERYYSIYSISGGESKKEISFRSSLIYSHLFAPLDKECYYIEQHLTDDDEYYTLNRLELK